MPSANGVYTLPIGYLAVTGATIQASQHNPPLEDIAAGLTARLSRDGTAPMTGALQAAVGSASAPSFTFSTDNSKGFYATTSGIGIAIGGAQVAEITAGGISGVFIPGMLLPFAQSTVPSSLWVFPVGQTLSRLSFPTLWTIAQTEITAGSSFFNNGDGSTTFGIGDLRGRMIAAIDPSGTILTSATMTPDGAHLGATGGRQGTQLLTANLPAYTPIGSVSSTLNGGSGPQGLQSGTGGTVDEGGSGSGGTNVSLSVSSSFTGTAQGGTATVFTNMPPTMALQYILFVGN